MQDGDDFERLCSTVHDHVLIHAEKEHIPASQIGTPMAFAGNIGQTFKGIHEFTLDAVGNC